MVIRDSNELKVMAILESIIHSGAFQDSLTVESNLANAVSWVTHES